MVTGIATIPILLAKLYTVFPHLLDPIRLRLADVVERVAIVPLVAGGLFMLFSGLANTYGWYPWRFFFPTAHYWMAWVTMGAIVLHVGAKATTTRRALRRGGDAERAASVAAASDGRPHRTAPPLGRRGFLGLTGATAGFLAATTAGATFEPLQRLTLFSARRPDIGPQGLPVNRTAAQADVLTTATADEFRLTITDGDEEALSLTLADLEALPRRAATLPIACVEGWSANADWAGVPVRDLIELAGIDRRGRDVRVHSLQERGLYNRSTLNPSQVDDGDTMLALDVNGARLDLDHGFPTRLIAPNRPGVLQTKWVTRVEVR